MKLAVLGGGSEASDHFISYAKKQGFSVNFVLASDNIENAIANSDAVVCLLDFTLDAAMIELVRDSMQDYGVRRLVIASCTLDVHQEYIQNMLKTSGIDWTIVQTIEQAEEAIDHPSGADFFIGAKELAKFLVNQITDSRHIQASVLLKN